MELDLIIALHNQLTKSPAPSCSSWTLASAAHVPVAGVLGFLDVYKPLWGEMKIMRFITAWVYTAMKIQTGSKGKPDELEFQWRRER